MQDPAIGKEVDGYRILGVLGRGGMGVVYQAEDVALSRTVAIKRIDPALANDEAFLRRFRSEARALARIDSPHIVSVHALRKTDLGLLIVMEYVDGGTLKDRFDAGPMEVGEALPIIRQMLTALEHAHGAGVIHRDIKPHNIMLTEAGRVKVTDFGLAKVYRPDVEGTVTQGVYGTLNYMSPEQVRGLGQVDHRSDIYSLGVTIYEMLAGRLPFDPDGGEFAIMRAIVEDEFPPLDRFQPRLPASLVRLVMTSLEKEPAQRFQSADEMLQAFAAFEKKQGQSAEAAGTASAASPAQANERWRVGLLAALVVLLLGGGYAAYSQLAGGEGTGAEPETTTDSVPSAAALSVTSEPEGAAVLLDGRAVGRTPIANQTVTGESLALRLEMDGYRAVDTTLYVTDANPALDVQLEAAPSEPEQTEDDASEPASETPVADAGTATEEESDGGEAAAPARATLDLDVDPGGTIRVGDAVQGRGSAEVPAGRHRVRFEHPEYGTKDTTVAVAAGETLSLTCYFEQTISVNHEGAWGNVWINGENTGQSTPHTFTRGPGTYRIELRIQRDGYTIPEGGYRRSAGGDRFADTFSGNARTVTIAPTFTPTRHAITFRAESDGAR